MKHKKTKHRQTVPHRGRAAARHAGKRQIPHPHEHMLMAMGSSRYDPDNDNDYDVPGQADNDAPAGP